MIGNVSNPPTEHLKSRKCEYGISCITGRIWHVIEQSDVSMRSFVGSRFVSACETKDPETTRKSFSQSSIKPFVQPHSLLWFTMQHLIWPSNSNTQSSIPGEPSSMTGECLRFSAPRQSVTELDRRLSSGCTRFNRVLHSLTASVLCIMGRSVTRDVLFTSTYNTSVTRKDIQDFSVEQRQAHNSTKGRRSRNNITHNIAECRSEFTYHRHTSLLMQRNCFKDTYTDRGNNWC